MKVAFPELEGRLPEKPSSFLLECPEGLNSEALVPTTAQLHAAVLSQTSLSPFKVL